jgi:probable phosphoglycerate mutase
MRIFLIRHGETAWTLSGQHTGRSDIPLTEKGKQEARQLEDKLKPFSFEKVLCSPSQRAKETCRFAGYLEQAELLDDLAEWDYGRYEGLTRDEILKKDPNWTVFSKGAPGGESLKDIEQRTARVLSLLKGLQGDVALFSSGHFLRALAASWIQLPISMGAHLALFPASLSILSFEHQTPVLLLWNSA